MVKIGLIGLGFMGQTHFKCYQKIADAKVVAIADIDVRRTRGDLSGSWGNLGDAAGNQLPMEGIKGVSDYRELLKMPDVDLVDVCVPTPLHLEVVLAALQTGKHVICEKPLARTAAEAAKIAEAAAARDRGMFMPAMCIRFWPQWAWLKQAVAEGTYGKVRGATFRRVASMPPVWYGDGAKSGGAILDLHVHDTDFVCYLFGSPKGVFSRGYTKTSGEIDHVVTQYLYDQFPLVSAEGSWCMADGFGFSMQYAVNFESATADYDIGRKEPLVVCRDGTKQVISCKPSDGWLEELGYFVQCIRDQRKPTVVTAADALQSIRVVEAERASIREGRAVSLG